MAVSCDLIPWLCVLAPFVIFFQLISRKTSKLPPGPVGFPVVGSLLQLGEMPNESLARLSKLYGPLMALRLGFRTTVLVSSKEMAEDVLQKHDQAFAGRVVMDAANVLDYPKLSMTLNQNCPRWRELRRICNTELFTPKRLDAMRVLREEKVRALLQHVRLASVDGRPVDIGECAFATTLNLVSNTVFSQDVVDLESESAGEFKGIIWGMMEAAGKPNLADYFPALRLIDPQGLRRRVKSFVKQLFAVFDDLINKRLESYTATGGYKKTADFLDVLLELVEKPSSGFTRKNIRPLLSDLLFAGSETSGITVEWAMTELLRQPEKMAAAQSEVKRVIGISRFVRESDLPQLFYLQAVVKETLRLHPPVPLLLPHKADVTTEVAGYTIPKHTQVLVNAWAISRDAAYWENPTSFMPERFIGSEVNFKGNDFEFIPFGAGRRICPGMPLADRMIHLVLASLIHSFSWQLPGGIEPEKLDVRAKFGLTLQKAVPLRVLSSPLIEM